MASSPFKRICIQATRQRRTPAQQTCQWQRYITTTPQRNADTSETSLATQDDAFLDRLASKPGVRYRVTEESEDTGKLRQANDLSAAAHRELEQHRELREVTRIAAWEMPLLAQLAKPYEPPTEQQVLRWRYTTYMGESHPASRKVVVEFKPTRLTSLNPQQKQKLLKLAGPRYNPQSKLIKLSCESFETQAQNKRYLADTITKLLAESTDPNADSFADIPLDTRHHKQKIAYHFPREWLLTPERKAELAQKRKSLMLEEAKRIEEDRLVSGLKAIEEARQVELKKEEEPIMVNARQTLSRGKMGKKEMGQQQRNNRP